MAEGSLDAKSLHDHSADAVCKAPCFVLVPSENLPRQPGILLRYRFELHYLFGPKLFTQTECTLEFAADLQKGKQFVNYVVRCDERFDVCIKPSVGRRVIGIVGYEPSEPRTCVNKYHDALP